MQDREEQRAQREHELMQRFIADDDTPEDQETARQMVREHMEQMDYMHVYQVNRLEYNNALRRLHDEERGSPGLDYMRRRWLRISRDVYLREALNRVRILIPGYDEDPDEAIEEALTHIRAAHGSGEQQYIDEVSELEVALRDLDDARRVDEPAEAGPADAGPAIRATTGVTLADYDAPLPLVHHRFQFLGFDFWSKEALLPEERRQADTYQRQPEVKPTFFFLPELMYAAQQAIETAYQITPGSEDSVLGFMARDTPYNHVYPTESESTLQNAALFTEDLGIAQAYAFPTYVVREGRREQYTRPLAEFLSFILTRYRDEIRVARHAIRGVTLGHLMDLASITDAVIYDSTMERIVLLHADHGAPAEPLVLMEDVTQEIFLHAVGAQLGWLDWTCAFYWFKPGFQPLADSSL